MKYLRGLKKTSPKNIPNTTEIYNRRMKPLFT